MGRLAFSFGFGFRGGDALDSGGSAYDPATLDWQTRALANGGDVTPTELAALDAFIVGCKTDGVWSTGLHVNVHCGSFLAALVPQIVGAGSSVWGTVNVVTGDYMRTGASGGVKGNGTNKYLNTGWNPVTAGASLTDCTLATYMRGVEATGATRMICSASGGGANINSLIMGLISAGSKQSGGIGSADGLTDIAPATSAARDGLLAISTRGSRSQQFYANGVPLGSPVTATGAFPSFPLFALAGNSSGTPFGFALASYLCALWIGTGLTAPQHAALYARMQTFQTALGRNV